MSEDELGKLGRHNTETANSLVRAVAKILINKTSQWYHIIAREIPQLAPIHFFPKLPG